MGPLCVYFRQFGRREFRGHLINVEHCGQAFKDPFFFCVCIICWDCVRNGIAEASPCVEFVNYLGS